MDASKVGVLAAELMDRIADEYGDDVEIDTVMLVVALDDGDHWGIETRSSDQRDWVKLGLVESVAAELRRYVSSGEHGD